MLLRFDPFRAVDRFPDPSMAAAGGPAMPMDAYRRGDHVVVHLDMPGVEPDTLDLTVERNVLTVSARREWQPAEADQVLVSERPQGTFTRQLLLGDTLAADDVTADYEHGVLTVTIPVAEQAKPRKVEIGGGRGGAIDVGSQQG